jgi:hypothetical protein
MPRSSGKCRACASTGKNGSAKCNVCKGSGVCQACKGTGHSGGGREQINAQCTQRY